MPAAPEPARPAVRSLADDLRARDDEALAGLLLARPDLLRPPPVDLTSLAARASTRASVRRAVEHLDTAALQVLQAFLISGDPVDLDVAAGLLDCSVDELALPAEHLWALALLWRNTAGRLHVCRSVADVFEPWVAGLAPLDPLRPGPTNLAERLAGAPAQALAILHRLTWGPPKANLIGDGALAQARDWLLRQELLQEVDGGHVLLPQRVALHLRGGRLHQRVELQPPAVPIAPTSPASLDHSAGLAAARLLDAVADLGVHWSCEPPRLLRSRGVAVRDLQQTAAVLDLSPEQTAVVIEVAHAAGLVDDDGQAEPTWVPTAALRSWQSRPAEHRWAELVTTWLAMPRAPHLVGQPAPVNPLGVAGPIAALSTAAAWPPVRAYRRLLLMELLQLDPNGSPDRAALLERLRWRCPLPAPELVAEVMSALLAECELLGLSHGGRLSEPARAWLSSILIGRTPHEQQQRDTEGVSVLAEQIRPGWLPPPASGIILQADLTAVVPGRVEGEIGHCLRWAARAESRGAATVYRFDADTIARAVNSAWTTELLLSALTRLSQTPLPQPLEYLIGDVGRRIGALCVGAAASYVRSDDPSVIEALLADRELAAAGLRRIAPTVAVSDASPARLVARLRRTGRVPRLDAADGVVVLSPLEATQAIADELAESGRADGSGALSGAVAAPLAPGGWSPTGLPPGLLRQLRASEAARTSAGPATVSAGHPPHLVPTEPAVTLSVLREAIAAGRPVWMGVVDSRGNAEPILFHPTRVEAGRVHGTAEGSARPHNVALARVRGAAVVTDSPLD